MAVHSVAVVVRASLARVVVITIVIVIIVILIP